MFDIIEIITLALIPGFMLLDLVYRHRKFESARFWKLRATLVTIGALFWSTVVSLIAARGFGAFHLFDGSKLGIAGGAIVGILVYEFFHYWYHRLAHRSDFLWRFAHQMHHSSESHDAFGANYGHPTDVAAFTLLPIMVFFPLLGLRPEAGVLGALFITFNAMFQHANIKTPKWLGYLIQRPESHGIHHQRGIHAFNYADLPLWDMVFGTFRNPTQWEEPTGFYRGASARIGDMLIGRDVSQPKPAETQSIPLKNAA